MVLPPVSSGNGDSSIKTSFRLTLGAAVGIAHIFGICFSGIEIIGTADGPAVCWCWCCCCRFRSFCETFSAVAESSNKGMNSPKLEEACAIISLVGSFSGTGERHDSVEGHPKVDGCPLKPNFGVANGSTAILPGVFCVDGYGEIIGFPFALNHVPSSDLRRLDDGLEYIPFPLLSPADNITASSSMSNIRSPWLDGFEEGEILITSLPSLLDFLRVLFGMCCGGDPNVASGG